MCTKEKEYKRGFLNGDLCMNYFSRTVTLVNDEDSANARFPNSKQTILVQIKYFSEHKILPQIHKIH